MQLHNHRGHSASGVAYCTQSVGLLMKAVRRAPSAWGLYMNPRHFTPVLKELHWCLAVRQRIAFKTLSLTYQVVPSDSAPSYLKSLLVQDQRSLEGRSALTALWCSCWFPAPRSLKTPCLHQEEQWGTLLRCWGTQTVEQSPYGYELEKLQLAPHLQNTSQGLPFHATVPFLSWLISNWTLNVQF